MLQEKCATFTGKFIILYILEPKTHSYQHIQEFQMTKKILISDTSWIMCFSCGVVSWYQTSDRVIRELRIIYLCNCWVLFPCHHVVYLLHVYVK